MPPTSRLPVSRASKRPLCPTPGCHKARRRAPFLRPCRKNGIARQTIRAGWRPSSRLVYWSPQAEDGQSDHSRLATSRFKDYRKILYEWNDSINRNLALLQHYFKPGMRHRMDNEVGGTFVEFGRVIEQWWVHDVHFLPLAPVVDRFSGACPPAEAAQTSLSLLIFAFRSSCGTLFSYMST